ncbi:hypothetical protein CVT24_008812 [Panaeolus cyanescens]|uniref:RNA-directed DNA polymerase n=1 Tax=Panaeolus cyanescens TaxID=181874 RepID=A0A409WRH3_9AGAR|nr:hypothetical protein CVT24_008812 [Panaeolus cyanescens]
MEDAIDDDDPNLLKYPPSPNNEILVEACSVPSLSTTSDSSTSPSVSTPAYSSVTPVAGDNSLPNSCMNSASSLFLRKLRTSKNKIELLQSWIKRCRWAEIDNKLVHFLDTADDNSAMTTLKQLQNDPFFLRSLSSKSLEVDTTIKTDNHSLIVKALIDSGATSCYISHDLVNKFNLSTSAVARPIAVYNADGSLNAAGAISSYCQLNISINDQSESLRCYVTNTGSSSVILGFSWLRHHNPLIDWKKGSLCFRNLATTVDDVPLAFLKPNAPPYVKPSKILSDSVPLANHDPDNLDDDTLNQDPLEEWHRAITDELTDEDESILVLDPQGFYEEVNNISVVEFIDDNVYSHRDGFSQVEDKTTIRLPDMRPSTSTLDVFTDYPDRYFSDYAKVFEKKNFDKLPPRRVWDHAIELKPDAKPVSAKIYPLARNQQEELDAFIKEHLETGRIRTSKSQFASPFFFVKKKDGSLRPVQDYRHLNEITIKNRYPLPLISELMDKLKGARFFTKLDIRWGYNNVRIKHGDEHKAAFITNRGLFEPLVMFFGLTNSPATFQTMMNELFKDLIDKGVVIVYMDDILIFTKDLASHRQIVNQVLQILQDNDLSLKPEKCLFEQSEVEYLGVIVSHNCIRMDPKKVEAIRDWPAPRNKKDVQQFLGFVNFYRRFIDRFSTMAKPLNNLCKNVPFLWSTDCQLAFENLKSGACAMRSLAIPVDDAPFRLEADSSGFATGATLSQFQNGEWKPISFLSKSLSETERNYKIHDRELLSIMRALSEWRHYLLGCSSPFEIWSDHLNLQYFMRNQKLNRRQARWSLELADFNFSLVHKAGSTMICADALSRRPDYDKGESDNDNITLLPSHLINKVTFDLDVPIIREIASFSNLSLEMFESHRNSPGWSFSDNLALWYNRIFVPNANDLRESIIRSNHDSPFSGHPGRAKTVELIQRDYWWPTLTKDVNRYVSGCLACQKAKPHRSKPVGLLSPNAVPTENWQIISVDMIVDLPRSRNYDSILVVVDRLSKMTRCIPTNKTLSSEGLARLYRDRIWKDFGFPARVISDRGSIFVSRFTKALNSLLNIDENTSTAFRPQTDGQTERMNQEIEQYLRFFVNDHQSDWSEWLACAEFSLNNRINKSTGYSPFFLNYGRHPLRPLTPLRSNSSNVQSASDFAQKMADLSEESKSALQLANSSMKRHFDSRHIPAPDYQKGDLVFIDASNITSSKPSKKLDWKRLGPFEILERIGSSAFKIDIPDDLQIHNVFNVAKLSPFITPMFASQRSSHRSSSSTSTNNKSSSNPMLQSLPIAQEILNHRSFRNNNTLFLVRLQNESSEDSCWLPFNKFSDPLHLIPKGGVM